MPGRGILKIPPCPRAGSAEMLRLYYVRLGFLASGIREPGWVRAGPAPAAQYRLAAL